MPTFFHHFETSSRSEREEIAQNLMKLYNRFYQAENDSFQALRESAGCPALYTQAQQEHRKAITQLGTIQAVFHELGIEFDGLYEEVTA